MTESPYWESRPDPIPGRWYWIKPTGSTEFVPAQLSDHVELWWVYNGEEEIPHSRTGLQDWYLIPLPPPAEAEGSA